VTHCPVTGSVVIWVPVCGAMGAMMEKNGLPAAAAERSCATPLSAITSVEYLPG
jgi:hypothetical protein